MVSPQAQISLTRSELLRLECEGGLEFANGQMVPKPTSIGSSAIEVAIGCLLGNEAARTGEAAVFLASMGYQCFADDPAKTRKPDVSLVRACRMAGINPDEPFMPIPAELAVEVISPKDLASDVANRVEEYLHASFPQIWIVYPSTRTVSIHRADGSVSLLHENDEIRGESALPEFKCKVADFFASTDKPSAA